MERLTDSVGRGGINHKVDVILVQKLLNHFNIPGEEIPLVEDGKIGDKTIARIEAFQKKILHMSHPDGRVDPNKNTYYQLMTARSSAKSAKTFSFSNKGIELLKSIEKLATTAYDDQTGKSISSWVKGATIGYGHLIAQSEWPSYQNGITENEALDLFKADLQPYENKVRSLVKTNLTQYEFDALIILTFNIGQKAFANSSVLKLINNPKVITPYAGLEEAWKAWNKSQGKINQGLMNRREAEWNIYSKNIYQQW